VSGSETLPVNDRSAVALTVRGNRVEIFKDATEAAFEMAAELLGKPLTLPSEAGSRLRAMTSVIWGQSNAFGVAAPLADLLSDWRATAREPTSVAAGRLERSTCSSRLGNPSAIFV
jgi:hypothetical protein